jgi:hypothetical protein
VPRRVPGPGSASCSTRAARRAASGRADAGHRGKRDGASPEDRTLEGRPRRKKPRGRPRPIDVARAGGRRSALRAPIGRIFACRKGKMGPFVRPIGPARARARIGLADPVHDMRRLTWLGTTAAAARSTDQGAAAAAPARRSASAPAAARGPAAAAITPKAHPPRSMIGCLEASSCNERA